MGAMTGLGSPQRFSTIADTRNQCGEDTIVWGSGIILPSMLAGAPSFRLLASDLVVSPFH